MEKPTDEELAKHNAITIKHIEQVQGFMNMVIGTLRQRALDHDHSKFEEPERSAYAVTIPKLAGLSYGTEEHKDVLRQMKPAIRHHYQANKHHPEYHNGVAGMDLVDIVEMVADWKAASLRGGDDFTKALEISLARFEIDDQLSSVIKNTAKLFEV